MMKLKYLLILLLFIPIVNVKAERIECGTYSNSVSGESHVVYVENGTVRHDNGELIGTLDYCPNRYYKWYCQSIILGASYSYRLEQSDNSGACNNVGTFINSNVSTSTSTPTQTPMKPSDKYKDIQTCDGGPYEYIQECGCIPSSLTDLTSRIFNLIKIAAPVLLLIVGGFDLIKAVTAQDEKAIQKEQTKLIKKFVAAFVIFILFTFVQMVAGLVSKDSEGTIKCIDYIVNGYKA